MFGCLIVIISLGSVAIYYGVSWLLGRGVEWWKTRGSYAENFALFDIITSDDEEQDDEERDDAW